MSGNLIQMVRTLTKQKNLNNKHVRLKVTRIDYEYSPVSMIGGNPWSKQTETLR